MCQEIPANFDLRTSGPPGPRPGSGRASTRRDSEMDNASDASNYSSPETSPTPALRKPPRADRPCDTCRKRKSRCVKEPDQDKCYLCTFHRRECTYLDEPQRRKKRKAEGTRNAPSHGLASSEHAATAGLYVEPFVNLACRQTLRFATSVTDTSSLTVEALKRQNRRSYATPQSPSTMAVPSPCSTEH